MDVYLVSHEPSECVQVENVLTADCPSDREYARGRETGVAYMLTHVTNTLGVSLSLAGQ